MAIGLAFAVSSVLPSVLKGMDFMKGAWMKISIAGSEIKLGTPRLFDLGVYFTVIGFSLIVIFTLMEETQWK